MAGPENAAKYQTLLFLAGSASAEFFADIGLCPWEAVKVSHQPASGASIFVCVLYILVDHSSGR